MAEEKLSKKERRELKKQQKKEKEAARQRKQTQQKYIGWGIGIAILIGLGFFLKVAFTPPPPGTIPELQSINANDHVKGASESATLLVEYSDFQCPACKSYMPIISQVVQERGDTLSFVYRHFPLAQHQNADEAARASEAAGKQNNFWEMHDMLFNRQEIWSTESNPDELFVSYAQELGLDIDQFTQDYQSEEAKNKVNTDYNSGVRAGVNSTPSFYLNGQKITAGSAEDFIRLIDQANTSE